MIDPDYFGLDGDQLLDFCPIFMDRPVYGVVSIVFSYLQPTTCLPATHPFALLAYLPTYYHRIQRD